MIDQFYTPGKMASNIFAGLSKSSRVADFAIGDGSLIKNLPFYPDVIYGLDIDDTTISNLAIEQSNWNMQIGDFLSPDESTKKWLGNLKNKIDLVVLNPPFSCKGKKRIETYVNEKKFICRIATAFLAKSLDFLTLRGQLIAILPLSSIKSESDAIVFREIAQKWDIEFGTKFGPSTFKGCSPNSIVIKLKRKTKENTTSKIISIRSHKKYNLEIVRGTVTMPETKSFGNYPVLHTVNLREGSIQGIHKFTDRKVKYVTGTYLCLPRVCKPLREKLVIVREQSFILSDCLIAVRTSERSIETVKEIILDNWDDFAALYESTCAPYITVAQLKAFFKQHEFSAQICDGFGATAKEFDVEKRTRTSA